MSTPLWRTERRAGIGTAFLIAAAFSGLAWTVLWVAVAVAPATVGISILAGVAVTVTSTGLLYRANVNRLRRRVHRAEKLLTGQMLAGAERHLAEHAGEGPC